ncbi:MAG: class I SAM-dependent RNA methyltransferase [Firmicutes bacterium]|nr:class I SAM-dependent RNA methyltransferase [Bacillota bacterium]
MTRLELIASATFGLEAVVKREVEELGYKITDSRDGRISYMADERGIVRSNLWLRCADRVYLKMAEFNASSFEELFQQTAVLPWEEWIPSDGRFTVIGSSVKSVLHSVPACQSIIKKAMVKRLGEFYGLETLPETGADYTVRFQFLKDEVTLMIDTSGEGLHKRGYRVAAVAAPIKETLAAAMIMLSFYKPSRLLVDPMCGSGTIPIEAAMIALNIAPGLSRSFASEDWERIPKELWKEERKKAFEAIKTEEQKAGEITRFSSGATGCKADSTENDAAKAGASKSDDADTPALRIRAYDIDPKTIHAARENALEAGVLDYIEFHTGAIQSTLKKHPWDAPGTQNKTTGSTQKEDHGVIITNPPYGQRIGEQEEIDAIYKTLKNFSRENPGWSIFLITADESFETKFGRPADRRRKLFNGNLKSCYYQYHGKK